MAEKEILTLRMTSTDGEGELTVQSDHPLVAHLRVALEKGRKVGNRWIRVYLLDENPVPLVFGTVLLTPPPRERLLFFPGTEIELEAKDAITQRFDKKRLDHLTLDPPTPKGVYRSHVTFYGQGKTRGIGFSTKPPQGSMVPWFSLLSPHLNTYHRLPKLLLIHFPKLRPDLQDFGNELLQSGDYATAQFSTLANDSTFFQFDTWVGKGKDWRALKSRPLEWASKPDVVQDAVASLQIPASVVTQFEIASELGIRIHCSRVRGKLVSDAMRVLRANLGKRTSKQQS